MLGVLVLLEAAPKSAMPLTFSHPKSMVKIDTTDEKTRPSPKPLPDAKEFARYRRGATIPILRRELAPFSIAALESYDPTLIKILSHERRLFPSALWGSHY